MFGIKAQFKLLDHVLNISSGPVVFDNALKASVSKAFVGGNGVIKEMSTSLAEDFVFSPFFFDNDWEFKKSFGPTGSPVEMAHKALRRGLLSFFKFFDLLRAIIPRSPLSRLDVIFAL